MWLGCVKPKYEYALESISLTNRSVCISPPSSNMNRISKKQVYSPGSPMLDSSISILRPTGHNLELTVYIKSENCLFVPSQKNLPYDSMGTLVPMVAVEPMVTRWQSRFTADNDGPLNVEPLWKWHYWYQWWQFQQWFISAAKRGALFRVMFHILKLSNWTRSYTIVLQFGAREDVSALAYKIVKSAQSAIRALGSGGTIN